MNTKRTDVVAEYLDEVDKRLTGLPVLQRRELLADLAAHIENERADRHLTTEGELIEVLERLGSPEAVAAAAHDEAGVPVAPAPKPQGWRSPAVIAMIGVAVAAVLLLCLGAFFLSFRSGSADGPNVAPVPTFSPR